MHRRGGRESVLAQSYREFELIVVDDGSTDSTPQVLGLFGRRIRVIRQDNRGVCAARNAGVLAAKGEWIAFLDSDDEWLPNKLEIQMRDLQRNPALVAHTTNAMLLTEDESCASLFWTTRLSRLLTAAATVQRPLENQVKYGMARLQCMVARRDALQSAGLFNETDPLPIYEDQDLACRLALEGPWFVTPRALARIRRRKGQTDNLSLLRARDPIRNAESLIRIYAQLLGDPRLTPGRDRPCQRNPLVLQGNAREWRRSGPATRTEEGPFSSRPCGTAYRSVRPCAGP